MAKHTDCYWPPVTFWPMQCISTKLKSRLRFEKGASGAAWLPLEALHKTFRANLGSSEMKNCFFLVLNLFQLNVFVMQEQLTKQYCCAWVKKLASQVQLAVFSCFSGVHLSVIYSFITALPCVMLIRSPMLGGRETPHFQMCSWRNVPLEQRLPVVLTFL